MPLCLLVVVYSRSDFEVGVTGKARSKDNTPPPQTGVFFVQGDFITITRKGANVERCIHGNMIDEVFPNPSFSLCLPPPPPPPPFVFGKNRLGNSCSGWVLIFFAFCFGRVPKTGSRGRVLSKQAFFFGFRLFSFILFCFCFVSPPPPPLPA